MLLTAALPSSSFPRLYDFFHPLFLLHPSFSLAAANVRSILRESHRGRPCRVDTNCWFTSEPSVAAEYARGHGTAVVFAVLQPAQGKNGSGYFTTSNLAAQIPLGHVRLMDYC